MKVEFNNKDFTLTLLSENREDFITLLDVIQKDRDTQVTPPQSKTSARKYSKPGMKTKSPILECSECGDPCRGKIGLGIHQRKMHGVVGKFSDDNPKVGKNRFKQRKRVMPEKVGIICPVANCNKECRGRIGVTVHLRLLHGFKDGYDAYVQKMKNSQLSDTKATTLRVKSLA